MKCIDVYVVEGATLERGMTLEKLAQAKIVRRSVKPSDPFSSQFSALIDAETDEKVQGHVFFSRPDAAEALRNALNPLQFAHTTQAEVIKVIEGVISGEEGSE